MGIHYDFTGATVLVTGGTRGVGHAVATAFATAGADVTVTGRGQSADDYDEDLSDFRYLSCDLAEPGSIDALVAELGRLDVLVNNAGGNFKPEWEPDVFDRSVALNLLAPFRLTAGCIDRLVASEWGGGGNIINVASITSFFAVDPVPGYGAAKAGVVQMTKAMASRWGPSGVRVNAVAPGVTETSMTRGLVSSPERLAPTLARTPLGRVATVDDVAPAFLFLASEAAGHITGQTLLVDGGYSIRG